MFRLFCGIVLFSMLESWGTSSLLTGFTNFNYNCPNPSSASCAALFLPNTSFANYLSVLTASSNDPEINMNTMQILTHRGYTPSSHSVTTKDGYILTVFRMGSKNGVAPTKGPILVQHGLLANSDCWFGAGSGNGESIPEWLAMQGYDVWLGNSRGNHYSQGHTTLNANDNAYWEFDWEDMGWFDLPAVIDYMLDNSPGFSKIGYVGHSQGTTQLYVLLTKKDDTFNYNEKISLAVLLAPVGFMKHLSGIPGTGAYALGFANAFQQASLQLGAPPQVQSLSGQVVPQTCKTNIAASAFCATATFTIIGWDPCQMNCSTLGFLLGHFPDSAPLRSLVHYGQEKVSGNFAQYDDRFASTLLNILNIPSSNAPANYTLTNISTNIVLVYGDNDNFARPADIDHMKSIIGNNVVGSYYYPPFNHFDFLANLNFRQTILDPLVYEFGRNPPS